MKKKVFYPFMVVLMLLALVHVEVYAAESNGSYTTMLKKQPTQGGSQEHDADDDGHRAPGRPICCTISKDSGVTIPGCPDDIISYEIWDADGNICLFASTDQSDFIDEIFSSHGEFMIRLNSNVYTYIGYISTL